MDRTRTYEGDDAMVLGAKRRRTIVTLCGAITCALMILAPLPTRGDSGDCVEPYLDRCLMSYAGCVDCDQWCRMVVGENCVLEFRYCVEDDNCTDPNWPIYEVCTCEVGSGEPPA